MGAFIVILVVETIAFALFHTYKTRQQYALGYLTALRDVQLAMTGHHPVDRKRLREFGIDEPHFSPTANAIINVLREELTEQEWYMKGPDDD